MVLARLLGDVQFGYYSYAMAWLSVGLILGKLGYDTALIRFVAAYDAEAEPLRVRGVISHARRYTLLASSVIAAASLCAVWQATVPSPLQTVLIATALLLPIAVFSEITASALRGFGFVGTALAGDGVVRPLVVLAVLVVAAVMAPAWRTAEYAMYAYLVGTIGSIALTMPQLSRAVPAVHGTAGGGAIGWSLERTWFSAALPMMFAKGFLVLLYTIDTLMLGWLADTTQAGYYSIASKIALLVLFAMNAVQSIATPMLAAAHASGTRREFAQVLRHMNLISVSVALPLAVLAAVGASWLLGLLGSGFESAAACLQVLAVMQAINVLTGPVGSVLSMTGHQQSLVGLIAFALCVNVLLNLAWIPGYGAVGAAFSALVSHTAWNLLGVVIVQKRLGVDCSVADLWRRTDGRPT